MAVIGPRKILEHSRSIEGDDVFSLGVETIDTQFLDMLLDLPTTTSGEAGNETGSSRGSARVVRHKEGLCGPGRAYGFVEAVAAHVSLAQAAHAVRIDGQNSSLIMARGAAHFAQSHLKALAVDHGSGPEKVVDGHIGGKEGRERALS
jgi:hypothetical protein